MKNILISYLEAFWSLLTMIAPYILIGIFLAAILKQLLNEKWIEKKLGGSSMRAVFRSILLGIPLPLCSCSVIPFATTLYKSGADKASTLGFLISTPITGIDSIVATYGVFGWFFTIYRIITSILIATVAGFLSLIFDESKNNRQKIKSGKAIFTTASPTTQSIGSFTLKKERVEDTKLIKRGFDITKVWSDAVYTIYKDFAKALLLGIVAGAALTAWIPSDITVWLGSNLWLNYIIVLIVSSLLYICATSSIPLGVALLTVGLTPGAVFILLTAGPATSMITMSVVLSLLGRKSLIIYLLSVLSITLLSGYMLDTLFADIVSNISHIIKIDKEPSFIGQISAVIMLYLSYKVLIPKKSKSSCGSSCGCG